MGALPIGNNGTDLVAVIQEIASAIGAPVRKELNVGASAGAPSEFSRVGGKARKWEVEI